MMNELQVFKNSEFGELGVLQINGKEYFPATACAKKLDYKNPQEAIRTHCKGVREILTPTKGGNQMMKFIPEGDLYRLIVSSHLPSAEKFEHWVFDEVLPSIRKQGAYGMPNFEEIILKTATAVATAIVQQLNVQASEPEQVFPYRRRACKVDRLNPHLRITVEQMLDDGFSYREIVSFLEENGEKMSAMAICTYAKKYFAALEMLSQGSPHWQYSGIYRR